MSLKDLESRHLDEDETKLNRAQRRRMVKWRKSAKYLRAVKKGQKRLASLEAYGPSPEQQAGVKKAIEELGLKK